MSLDFEYRRLIGELNDLKIARYRAPASTTHQAWHQDLDPLLERHRQVASRLREIAALRTAYAAL